jgi:hypothetical protein
MISNRGKFMSDTLIETNSHETKIPSPHAGQDKVIALGGRFKVAVCGRRFGKTVVAAIAAVRLCEKAKENEARRVWWISPVQEQADRVEREMAYWLSPKQRVSRKDAKAQSSETEVGREDDGAKRRDGDGEKQQKTAPAWIYSKSEHALTHVESQSRIEFHSAHVPDRLRGAGLDLVIIDEAADVSDYTWKMVIKPMLLDAKGHAIILGTPRGTQHWLHRVFMMGQSPEYAGRYSSIQLPTRENPLIPATDIEEYRREMSDEEFRQEFEAEFIDGVNAAFTNVAECVAGEPLSRGCIGANYITGIDLGQRENFTVLCSINVRTERLEGFARFNHMDWSLQIAQIAAHLKAFPGPCVVDETGMGGPVCELIRNIPRCRMKPFTFTQSSRQEILSGLQVAFSYRNIHLSRVPVLIQELQAMSLLQIRDNNGIVSTRFGVPDGFHDDCVMSLALAWHGLKKGLWGAAQGNGMQAGFFAGERN